MSNEPEPRQPQPVPPAGASPGGAPGQSSHDISQPLHEDDEPVPRLPRGRGLKLSFPEIARILMIVAMLIAMMMLRRPCAENTGRFIESFEPPVDAGPTRTPGQLPPGRYVPLTGEMTEQELRDKLELLDRIDAGAPGPAHPSQDTLHDREPPIAPDPRAASPISDMPAPDLR